MTEQKLYSAIQTWCAEHTDPVLEKKYSRYFKEGYDAYGLDRDEMHGYIESILTDDHVTFPLIMKTAPLLVASGKYEETMIAILLVKAHEESFTRETFDHITGWFDLGIVNWAHTDVLCGHLLSQFLTRGFVSLDDLSGWRAAPNKYQRRAVPVTMLELLKTTDHFDALFKFIEPLMTDAERVVQQGTGWFLREAWKLQRELAEAFLLSWKNDAPRVIYQYATEKMTKYEKQRFKRDNKR